MATLLFLVTEGGREPVSDEVGGQRTQNPQTLQHSERRTRVQEDGFQASAGPQIHSEMARSSSHKGPSLLGARPLCLPHTCFLAVCSDTAGCELVLLKCFLCYTADVVLP